MAKPRLIDVIDTLGQAVSDAINNAEIPNVDPSIYRSSTPVIAPGTPFAPGQTVAGWAVTTELVKILQQGKMNHLVVLWPLKPELSRHIYSPNDPYCQTKTPPTVRLSSIVTPNPSPGIGQPAFTLLQFIGDVDQPLNITLRVNHVRTLVQIAPPLLVTDVATAVGDAIDALGLDNVNVTVADDTVRITTAFEVLCSVDGTGTITTEVDRVSRLVQVSTYAPNPFARTFVDDAIVQGVGTNVSKWLTLSDGQALYVRNVGSPEQYREKAQSSYSAFEAHTLFRVEYPITVDEPATQIGAVGLSGTIV